ncbi:MAG: radical SAM protein, partial [Deltaproteobacteria bacterium]
MVPTLDPTQRRCVSSSPVGSQRARDNGRAGVAIFDLDRRFHGLVASGRFIMAKRRQEHGYGRALEEPMLRGDLSAWYGWWPQRLSVDELLAAWQSALARRGQPGSPATLQLYTHFAFCQASCAFCQYFHLVPHDRQQVDRYTDYLVALTERYAAALGVVDVTNAYFGGGTPSALAAAQLGRFLAAFARAFRVRNEFTCEGHPGNLDAEKLDLLAAAGVNRLSLGLQSLDPVVCRRIGRMNPPLERVRELVRRARALGMWVNADLVLGLPEQTPQSFLSDLDRLLADGRPDCLTVYRYQPVPHLNQAPDETMRYSRVLTPAVLLRALRQGYLPATSGGDDRPGKDFFRNSTRTWRQWFDRLRYEVVRMVRTDAELRSYAQFEDNDSHILGIGPGAMSHLYGHSWYREITAVATASTGAEPVYLGTRVTPADECRSALLQGFARSRWVDTRALGRRSGVDVEATFGPLFDAARQDRCLRRFARWVGCVPDASPSAQAAFFTSLLPALTGDAEARAQRAQETNGLRASEHVQRELVGIGDHLALPSGGPGASPSGAPQPPEDALLAWAQLIGLGVPGQRFASAVVERFGGSEVHFRLRPEPDPPLRVMVERDRGQPSFLRAGSYAISYVGRHGEPLPPAEEE